MASHSACVAPSNRAAYVAYAVRASVAQNAAEHVQVLYCVHDVATGRISSGVPGGASFAIPPEDASNFQALARSLASTSRLRALLLTSESGDSKR